MKNSFIYLFLIILFCGTAIDAQVYIYQHTALSSAGTYIGKYVDSTTSYGVGSYAIGKQNPYIGTTSAVYRSYFDYDLSQIPTNATIDTVIVYYSTGTGSGYSLK